MIVRVWKACATPDKAAAYKEHLETHVLPTLRSVPGFAGAELWQRRDGEEIELMVVSRWRSLDAVRQFAGDAFERAVVAPGARVVLASFEELVAHYEVAAECAA